MEKTQIIWLVCFISLLLILLVGFLLFVLFWQRGRSNRYIREREALQAAFNEQLLRSQLEIQEQSFNTISMEIHDNVGQTLSLLKVQLNIIEQVDQPEKKLIREAKENVSKAMADLRDIAKSMSTERIRSASLAQMTEHELKRISQTGILTVEFTCKGAETNLDVERKLILFRIIQECLQNILKHAEAKLLTLGLYYEEDHLRILIKDDGKGFDQQIVDQQLTTGLGIRHVLKRTAIIGGATKIESKLQQGTQITLSIPYA
ncbi:sensor histidine kinase [Mucilaginibacter sp. P25]|uniref:sensor histidine kinase n=1 Tax=Mucilaginibacter sp. P25 TaxID=3423945 RepID=UPI003D7B2626